MYYNIQSGQFFQVVGNSGTIEINPRDMMAKESSIVGVMLGQATEVLTKLLMKIKYFIAYNSCVQTNNNYSMSPMATPRNDIKSSNLPTLTLFNMLMVK